MAISDRPLSSLTAHPTIPEQGVSRLSVTAEASATAILARARADRSQDVAKALRTFLGSPSPLLDDFCGTRVPGWPVGPHRSGPREAAFSSRLDRVSLNPQPLPPRETALSSLLDEVSLNPQPLPPRALQRGILSY